MAKVTVVGVLGRPSPQADMLILTLCPWQQGDAICSDKKLIVRIAMSHEKATTSGATLVEGSAYRVAGDIVEQSRDMVWLDTKKLPVATEPSPELAAAAKERAKPVIVKHATLGKLELDRELRYFKGKVVLWGKRVPLSIETDDPDAVPGIAKHFAANASAKVKAIHYKAIVDKILKLANDWSDKPLTAKQLLATLVPESLGLDTRGGAVVYWKCGRVFHGHGIMTSITKAGRVTRAEMC